MADDFTAPTGPFSTLPDLMKTLTERDVFPQINMDIERQNGLTLEQGDKMMEVIRLIVLKTIKPEALVATIVKTVSLKEPQAKKLALDLLGRQFLPMQWYIGNVEGEITKLGGDVVKYEAEARKNYPEVYVSHAQEPKAEPEKVATPVVSAAKSPDEEAPEPEILHLLNDRLSSQRGRAEVLLRLTNLSAQVEDAIKEKKIPEDEGQALYKRLDALSFAINTQDLNPLEVAAIRRQLKSVLAKLGQV